MSTQISARVDKGQMQEFQRICNTMGLSVSSAINIYVKQVIRKNGLPFAMTADDSCETTEAWQKRSEARLLQRKKDLDNGKGLLFTADEWEKRTTTIKPTKITQKLPRDIWQWQK